ncbi:aminodeoxychorismate synthase component I [Methylomonas paludis]|uniref:aminodeoxychorismate synthase n=1 Tax=Methylomonas paludis TaxID=1173101 RepID=A0A975R984_9GAMM|nr:aminodeoxychorismate synthase component I [Methylomonas paludis]QWF69964.1 aminodeoxychorismate synthase component I [Methylomonas paludis]
MSLDNVVTHALPYFEDSALIFAPLANRPWAVFLDSAHPLSQQGRFDILAYGPVCTLQTYAELTLIDNQGVITHSLADPFQLLKQHLGPPRPAIAELPFNGGAIGYFGYDLARRIEKLPELASQSEGIADMAIGIYQWAVIVDHQLKQSWLVAYDLTPSRLAELLEEFSHPAQPPLADFQVLAEPSANMDKTAYAGAFNKIKAYLAAGDCYQVNLTQRFVSPCQGDAWVAYQVLRQINAAPFSAYLNLADVQILSSSPERFLQVRNGQVETKPIKGTRPRKASASEDQAQIQALAASEKDRAENLMIVDLLRNDIGKSCREGTVQVPELFAVESFATVHHLVSTITGVLAPDQQAVDLLRSCFPGGSITGAPKIRAMEIIEELEPHRRGVYCGAIGYIGFDGNMDTNIAIRTLVYNQHSIRFWAGGGITYDSQLDAEYQECFDKAAALLQLLARFKV